MRPAELLKDPHRKQGWAQPVETVLRVFIGYDPREAIAYHVLSHSILSRATCPISITPVARNQLFGIYGRDRGPTESTDFARTRFLVPYLCNYQGYAVFMDCDMLVRCDLGEVIWREIRQQPDKAVLCCQHEYTPKTGTKFLGQPQTAYPRKNWSSFMVFNTGCCNALTRPYVNTATGLDLHRFNWLECDHRIGALPLDLNWLVGEYEANSDARILHWTRGGPWFPEFEHADHADDWRAELAALNAVPEMVG